MLPEIVTDLNGCTRFRSYLTRRFSWRLKSSLVSNNGWRFISPSNWRSLEHLLQKNYQKPYLFIWYLTWFDQLPFVGIIVIKFPVGCGDWGIYWITCWPDWLTTWGVFWFTICERKLFWRPCPPLPDVFVVVAVRTSSVVTNLYVCVWGVACRLVVEIGWEARKKFGFDGAWRITAILWPFVFSWPEDIWKKNHKYLLHPNNPTNL